MSVGEWRPPQLAAEPRRPVVQGSGHRGACVSAVVVAGVGAAVASWWLIGNLSARSRFPGDLEYVYKAPTVPHWVVLTFGPIAAAGVVVVAACLIGAAARGLVDRRWLRVAGVSAVAGFLLAGIGRTESAGSVGANIGGGIAIVFGLPIVVALIAWAVLDSRKILRG